MLIQAVIAGALSFAHLHDLASAAGQAGWKAWAYPISVDLLLVAAWHRIRTLRASDTPAGSAWCWFCIALAASLGANVATAGLLDLHDVPAWLRILVAGWPAARVLRRHPSRPHHAPKRPTATRTRSTPTFPRLPRQSTSTGPDPTARPSRTDPGRRHNAGAYPVESDRPAEPAPAASLRRSLPRSSPRPEGRRHAPLADRSPDRHRHPPRPPRRPGTPRRGHRRTTRLKKETDHART